MKKPLISLMSLMIVGGVALAADKVVITSEPAMLKKDGDVYVYTTPTDYVTTSTYHYVAVDGTNRVCYPEVQTQFVDLTPTPIQVRVNDSVVTWQCYDATNSTYFQVTR